MAAKNLRLLIGTLLCSNILKCDEKRFGFLANTFPLLAALRFRMICALNEGSGETWKIPDFLSTLWLRLMSSSSIAIKIPFFTNLKKKFFYNSDTHPFHLAGAIHFLMQ